MHVAELKVDSKLESKRLSNLFLSPSTVLTTWLLGVSQTYRKVGFAVLSDKH